MYQKSAVEFKYTRVDLLSVKWEARNMLGTKENLDQIRMANQILNKGYKSRITVAGNKLADEVRLSGFKPFAKQGSKRKSTMDSKKLTNGIMLTAVIVVAVIIFAFTPFAKSITLNSMFKFNTKPTKIQKVSDQSPLMILSGTFDTQRAAQAHKTKLEERLGVKLEVIKFGKKYTVRIGPSFNNHEDAMLVFNELSKYKVKDLVLSFENPAS